VRKTDQEFVAEPNGRGGYLVTGRGVELTLTTSKPRQGAGSLWPCGSPQRKRSKHPGAARSTHGLARKATLREGVESGSVSTTTSWKSFTRSRIRPGVSTGQWHSTPNYQKQHGELSPPDIETVTDRGNRAGGRTIVDYQRGGRCFWCLREDGETDSHPGWVAVRATR